MVLGRARQNHRLSKRATLMTLSTLVRSKVVGTEMILKSMVMRLCAGNALRILLVLAKDY